MFVEEKEDEEVPASDVVDDADTEALGAEEVEADAGVVDVGEGIGEFEELSTNDDDGETFFDEDGVDFIIPSSPAPSACKHSRKSI